MVNAQIVAYGWYAPDEVLSNDFFVGKNPYRRYIGQDANGNPLFDTELVHLDEDKILNNTGGIRERRRVAKGQDVVDLVELAFRNSDFDARELRGIAIGTISDEMRFPSVACRVQRRLGLGMIDNAVDFGAACSGFTEALHYACLNVMSGSGPYLAAGVEILTRIVDYDEMQCDLFGDGCGVVVVAPTNDRDKGILATAFISDVSDVRGTPGTETIYKDRLGFLRMPHGPKVKATAWRGLVGVSNSVLNRAGIGLNEVKMIFPSQANGRIIDEYETRMGLNGISVVYRNLDRFGNTSAASIPMAYAEARQKGLLKEGDAVIGASVGSGMVWGSFLERI